MAGTYLELHPPVRSQYRNPRRENPSGVVVVHDAENATDIRPPDTGAEAVAAYIRVRTTPGSYHDLADSDSILRVIPYEWEAFQDGTGSNPHAYAVSGAYRLDQWAKLPPAWKAATVRNMALAAAGYAKWLRATHGVVIPARRITRAESERRIPGFISHHERDPARRQDPGPEFPWLDFLHIFAVATSQAPTSPTPTGDSDMAHMVTNRNGATILVTGSVAIKVKTTADAKDHTDRGIVTVGPVSDEQYNEYEKLLVT